jgi:hypothetical protein
MTRFRWEVLNNRKIIFCGEILAISLRLVTSLHMRMNITDFLSMQRWSLVYLAMIL